MNINKRILLLLFPIILVSGFFSCWYYSFSGKSLPGIETIAIPLFTNRTAEIQIREQLQSMLISAFQDENILKVVGQNQADAVLNGVIEAIRDEAVSLNNQEQARQFEVYVDVQIKLENRKTGKVLYTGRLSGLGVYQDLQNRDEAVDKALSQLTRDISNKVVSGW